MILCCGEALVDMVPVVKDDGQTHYAPLNGGAVFNTAIALGRLDVPVQLLSGVSNDLFGRQLATALVASGVGTNLLIRSDRPTTLAFVALTQGQAEYTFYDENSASRMITRASFPDTLPTGCTLYFGGISLCAEPAAQAYEEFALMAAEQHTVMLDPNIRIGFIDDEHSYRARLDRMIAVSDIVKVSNEDLDWIMLEETSVLHKVQALHDKGAKLVVLTQGGSGASAYLDGRHVATIPARKVEVVDTVGAGDTFNAGLLASLYENGMLDKNTIPTISDDALEAALEFATMVAAVTVSRRGANPPFKVDLEA